MEKSAFKLESTPVDIPSSTLARPVITYDVVRNLWVLERDYIYENNLFSLTIASGFCFDLASIPAPFWPIVAPFHLSIAAPLVHDYLYQRGGIPDTGAVVPSRIFSRLDTDNMFREIMERERVPWWRQVVAYYAVRLFGRFAWKCCPKPVPTMKHAMIR